MTAVVGPADVQAVVDRFNQAWADHDLDAAVALCSPDCVFESTSPSPDGTRYVGHAALRDAWKEIFADTAARFSTEESFATAEHVVQRWRYDWDGGHVRGIDQIDVRGGLVVAKLAYVKG